MADELGIFESTDHLFDNSNIIQLILRKRRGFFIANIKSSKIFPHVCVGVLAISIFKMAFLWTCIEFEIRTFTDVAVAKIQNIQTMKMNCWTKCNCSYWNTTTLRQTVQTFVVVLKKCTACYLTQFDIETQFFMVHSNWINTLICYILE